MKRVHVIYYLITCFSMCFLGSFCQDRLQTGIIQLHVHVSPHLFVTILNKICPDQSRLCVIESIRSFPFNQAYHQAPTCTRSPTSVHEQLAFPCTTKIVAKIYAFGCSCRMNMSDQLAELWAYCTWLRNNALSLLILYFTNISVN